MSCKLLIFDLDGTILDTTEGILESVKYTIEHFQLEMLPHEQLLTFIGPPIQDSFARAYGLSGAVLQEIADVFRAIYSQKYLLEAKPYDGIFQLFESLQQAGIQTAVATYKREDYAIRLLKHFGFDKYITVMHGGDNFNQLKKSDIITQCIEESSVVDKNEVVMVGDTIFDAAGAAALGLRFIAVTYGFGFRSGEQTDMSYLGYANRTEDIYTIINQL